MGYLKNGLSNCLDILHGSTLGQAPLIMTLSGKCTYTDRPNRPTQPKVKTWDNSGKLQAVFASPLLHNHMRLFPSYIRHPPLSLPSRLPLLPNPHDLCCRVYGLVFWAAAPKGSMTYAFTYGEFSFPPSIRMSVRLSFPPPQAQGGLIQALGRPDPGLGRLDPGSGRPNPSPGRPKPCPEILPRPKRRGV